jgi:hypothetical protein
MTPMPASVAIEPLTTAAPLLSTLTRAGLSAVYRFATAIGTAVAGNPAVACVWWARLIALRFLGCGRG